MNLLPFRPMRNADQLRREINRLYSLPFDLFEDEFAPRLAVPFTDVYETDEEIIVSCDLPGLQRREDVSIQIENNMITISGTLNREQHVIQEDRLHKKKGIPVYSAAPSLFRRPFPLIMSGQFIKTVF